MREYRCLAIPRMISENDGIECPIPLSKLSIQWPGRPDQTTQITSLLARRPLCAGSGHSPKGRHPNRTLRAPRQELWYPPSNAMGRFNEAADPQMALEQFAQYGAKSYFEVTGCHSGKRYRISHGSSMNIHELDGAGLPCVGWCFAPKGYLVAGDVMLAQKIALETDERGALAVANKFFVPTGRRNMHLHY